MAQADPDRTVQCKKLDQELPGLARPPFPNEFGQWLFENVSHQAWEEWLKESVRYINTYRVDLASKQGAEFMMKQIKVHFGLEEGDKAETAWVPPEK